MFIDSKEIIFIVAKMKLQLICFLSAHPEVLCVIPSRVLRLKTTRTFNYLGLLPGSQKGLLHDTSMGSEVIIGVIDSGLSLTLFTLLLFKK